jgi:hypothetical protein
MKKQLVFLSFLIIYSTTIMAQNIGIGTTTPNTSAMLDITATNKGLLVPRVALTDARDITTIPAAPMSLLIYNTATAGSGSNAVVPGFYYWNNLSALWISLATGDNSIKSAWLLGGNNATLPANNFIGTSDSQAVVFKINNTYAGYLGTTGNTYWGLNSGNINSNGYSNVAIGNAALLQTTNRNNLVAIGDSALLNNGVGAGANFAIQNTAVGSKALYSNTIGYLNTANGFQSLFSNIDGYDNTATGSESLQFNTSGYNNTATGARSLRYNTSGYDNTANGFASLLNNTNGHENTANGYLSLAANNIGSYNTANGYQSLLANTSGSYNTGTGGQSLWANTSGNNNTANGYQTLFANSDGYSNTAIGTRALYSNASGDHNVAVGDSTLFNNYSNNNTAIGSKALLSNTSGYRNTAIGLDALYNNTGGYSNTGMGVLALFANSIGLRNNAFGDGSLANNSSGNDNIAMGFDALYSNQTGNGNVALGGSTLSNTTTGLSNTAVGTDALLINFTGSYNTALGYAADVTASNINNATVIGYNAKIDNANSMVFGNTSVLAWAFGRTSVASGNALQVGSNATNGNGARLTVGGVWTNASDSTKKDGITKLDGNDILAKLKQLPVTRWKYKGTNEYHIGPMAQDFYKLFNVGTDNKTISSIDPAGIALKAIQEQQQMIEQLIIAMEAYQHTVETQNKKLEDLEKRLEALENKK